MTNSAPTPPETQPNKMGLYVKLAFGAVVLFGIVGSIAGYRERSTLVFILVSVCWALGKILVEAIDAYRILTTPSSRPPPPKSKPPIDPPPGAPVVA